MLTCLDIQFYHNFLSVFRCFFLYFLSKQISALSFSHWLYRCINIYLPPPKRRSKHLFLNAMDNANEAAASADTEAHPVHLLHQVISSHFHGDEDAPPHTPIVFTLFFNRISVWFHHQKKYDDANWNEFTTKRRKKKERISH